MRRSERKVTVLLFIVFILSCVSLYIGYRTGIIQTIPENRPEENQTSDAILPEKDKSSDNQTQNNRADDPAKQDDIQKSEIITDAFKIPILYYHAVDDETFGIEQLFVRPSEFEKQMKYISENFTPIYFNEIDNAGSVKNPIIITLDDGYRDNYTYAYPILKKYNVKATVFLVPEYIDKPKFLAKEHISEMKGLVSFQSHTMDHTELDKVSEDEIIRQMTESKKYIEELTGEKVNVLAYPVGLYNDRVVRLAKKYYDFAVTIDGGVYTTKDDRHTMKRIYIKREDSIEKYINKLRVSN